VVLDCQDCGACCFSQLRTYVRVMGADHARLGDAAERLTVFEGNRCYMRMDAGHCAALTRDDRGRFTCSIYAERPAVCRELERGSPACEAERALKSSRCDAAHAIPGVKLSIL
jgi:Fe-S-cluster containining protein